MVNYCNFNSHSCKMLSSKQNKIEFAVTHVKVKYYWCQNYVVKIQFSHHFSTAVFMGGGEFNGFVFPHTL